MDSIPGRRTTKLTDGKILLRPSCKSDADNLYKAVRESLKELGQWMPWAHPGYSLKETKEWLKKKPDEWKRGISFDFAIISADGGKFLGGCGINDMDYVYGKANLGYWVRTSEAGRGVATAVTLMLAKWGLDVLKLNRIEICVAKENVRSLRVAEKAGAKREGVLRNRLSVGGVTHDAVMHSLIPGDMG